LRVANSGPAFLPSSIVSSAAAVRGASATVCRLPPLRRGSVVIPLGRAVDAALGLLIDAGVLDPRRCCLGFPHPSGANGHRISQFDQVQDTLRDKLSAWFSTGSTSA
jgi:hypothetical protein